jgi:Tfp pilus assembly protein PilN
VTNASGNEVTTTQVVGTSGVRLPRVNLLPPEIHEAARFRRFQLAMVGAGVAAVAVVGALAYMAHSDVSKAKSQVAAAQAEQANLQKQQASLQYVADIRSQVDAKKAMLVQAMSPEIRWSYYLNDLSLRIPDHVWLTNLTATETGATAAPSTSTAAAPALAQAGIGTVTFGGVAFSHDDVATWLDTLAKEKGFANAYFSNSSKSLIGSRSVVDFTSSVTVTSAALSGRYTAVEG